jgi:hypothetical protein
MSYIAPQSPSLGPWPPPAAPLTPVPNCCIILTPDDLDGVFKKITTPLRRRRLFRRPNLGFPPAGNRGEVRQGEDHEHAFKKETTPIGVAVVSIACR